MIYVIQERPSDTLAVISGQIWHRVKARKHNTCAMTNRPIVPGDMVYRPHGNGDNRMHRILAARVERPAARSALGEQPEVKV